ncbi:PREDICTED: radiation-inducible immediate-early gene IEX-1 [Thamnophis sirtalis]|uniref:Radiation-inducible immediate-early gene IEX-1 n=1 Tax=Thamnophis sirtalis TaxID=35019 RepID=A0A6I9YPH0_9SAUR|nr:PREDICTED: radiation-inducible immediate-early gene IEX-1 [Thamnophis sirtalis]
MPQLSARAAPTGPQYFTFDPLPEDEKNHAAHRSFAKTSKHKRRSRKVLYPPVVKRYYPTQGRSSAKTLLFILLAIVFFQIYNAEDDLLLAGATLEDNTSGCSLQGWESQVPPVPSELPIITEQPVVSTTFSLEITTVANVSEWPWGEERSSESTVDITHFLQQNPAAF